MALILKRLIKFESNEVIEQTNRKSDTQAFQIFSVCIHDSTYVSTFGPPSMRRTGNIFNQSKIFSNLSEASFRRLEEI